MAFGIMMICLLVAAIIGGYANYLLPANSSEDGKTKLRGKMDCIILGLTATILVPLFLELAQSKLLDGIRFSFDWAPSAATASRPAVGTDTMQIITVTARDSGKEQRSKSDTTIKKARKPPSTDDPKAVTDDLGRSYCLWIAYCMVAAAAGFRFIDMLINNVVKQGEIKNLKTANKELIEKDKKEATQNRVNAQFAELKATEEIVKEKSAFMKDKVGSVNEAKYLPAIGPITHLDDPQKGRFGGESVNNFRRLAAKVNKSLVPGFYKVVIWVESTDPEKHPLVENVIFYIHDTFRPNVFTITPVNGRAEDTDILSYGAFTVGAVTDYGETLLELDLAEDNSFPKAFREL